MGGYGLVLLSEFAGFVEERVVPEADSLAACLGPQGNEGKRSAVAHHTTVVAGLA